MKGKFITFEGCEGVGKTTQVELLKKYLKNTNQQAIFLREPGGSKISEQIRKLILSTENVAMTDECEAFLYSSARAQLVGEIIRPALNNGNLVICDRFIDSTFAYQGVARGLGEDYVDNLNRLACKDVIPEVTIFLDLEPSKGFARKGGADKNDRIEQEKADFHQKVYQGYKLASQKYADRIVCIDASRSIENIHSDIIGVLRDRGIVK